MERTVDRTSYRRSARGVNISKEKNKTKNKKLGLINFLLNFIIVSLLIIVFILISNYFEIDFVTKWVSDNLLMGHEVSEVLQKINKKIIPNENAFILSGENMEKNSGEVSGDMIENTSGDMEYITAVEGVNQMSEDAKTINSKYKFFTPLKGTVTSNFGCRVSDNSIVSSYHTGLDIAANSGTEIFAAHDGKVTMAKKYSTYGNCIIIEHENLITLYAHCSSLNVKEGQLIKKGNLIGKVGMTGNATGPHLHFEVKYDGRYVNPKDVLGDI